MMGVERQSEHLNASAVLTALLAECSAVTDYRTLRDSLPRRLAVLLRCRCVLLYQRIGETLQFAAGTFDEKPGWSASLLAVAQINPIDLNSKVPEAQAWRERHAITIPAGSAAPTLVAVPLLYRQRAIGVLVAIRDEDEPAKMVQSAMRAVPISWSSDEVQVVEAVAGVIAMLLENTRLLERDQQRIHELSLLNSISSQLNYSMYELERVKSIVIQRTREISTVDLCDLILPSTLPGAFPWITSSLYEMLLQSFTGQKGANPSPLVMERPGDPASSKYLDQLDTNIKTFFAIPIVSSRGVRKSEVKFPHMGETGSKVPGVQGIIVGAYHQPWKLRREELVLLQVLANQVGIVLENIHLMTEVIEARNEARKLLRQVLDDQRLKELILESIPSGLITVDLRGQIATFNRAAVEVLGYLPYEVVGQPLQKIIQLASLPRVLSTGREKNETIVAPDRDGQEIVLDVTMRPLRNERGELVGALITFIDVTSVRHLEEEKRRLDRLASLGEMAANVAHEVRNPLASIKTSMQMLMDDLARDRSGQPGGDEGIGWMSEGTQESVSVVLKEVERLDTIVRDLLLFARPRQLHRAPCNLVALSEHVLQVMQTQLVEAGIVVHRVYHEVPMVQVDIAQMEQVLFNLFMNALQAMPEGGVLSISCQVVCGSEATRRSLSHFTPVPSPEFGRAEQQDWLELSVIDTGVGIAADQLDNIFQPFFTSKAHGIGLGLPITRRLVEDHHGHILVESQLGYGTTISVRLPLVDVSDDGIS
jgi:PAS domain S-box-containing protein